MNLQQHRPLAPVGMMSVRRATPEDFSSIVSIAHKAGVFTPAELASLHADLESCDQALGDHILVQELDGVGLTGFIQFSPAPITNGSWYVYWIAVAKDTHGQGVGAALLAAAEQAIRGIGGRQIVIETSALPQYEAARRFYLRKDYTLVARVPDYYNDGDDKCIFVKKT